MTSDSILYKYPSSYGEIIFSKPEFYDNTKIWGGLLSDDTELVINSLHIVFKKDSYLEIPDGDLLCGVLKQDTTLLLNNSPYTFGMDTKLIFKTCVKNKYIQSGKFPKSKKIMINNNFYITSECDFYESGTIKSLILDADTLIIFNSNPIALKKGTSVHFFPSGNIERITPLSDIEIKSKNITIKLKKEEAMFFFENGNFKRGKLRCDIHLVLENKEVTIAKDHIIEFNENGTLKNCTFK